MVVCYHGNMKLRYSPLLYRPQPSLGRDSGSVFTGVWEVIQPPLMKIAASFSSDFLRNSSWGVSTRWGSRKQEDNRRLFTLHLGGYNLVIYGHSHSVSGYRWDVKAASVNMFSPHHVKYPDVGTRSQGTGNSKSIFLVSSEEGKKAVFIVRKFSLLNRSHNSRKRKDKLEYKQSIPSQVV